MYIPKLLLNVVTGGTEALVISGNKVLCACVKEVCRVIHILTPSINFTSLIKCCDLNQFFRQVNK
jgi:hypothetical protein